MSEDRTTSMPGWRSAIKVVFASPNSEKRSPNHMEQQRTREELKNLDCKRRGNSAGHGKGDRGAVREADRATDWLHRVSDTG
jgi:hypothetical protein